MVLNSDRHVMMSKRLEALGSGLDALTTKESTNPRVLLSAHHETRPEILVGNFGNAIRENLKGGKKKSTINLDTATTEISLYDKKSATTRSQKPE